MDGLQKYAFKQSVNISLPVPLLLGVPQGSPFLDPSPKGSLDGEVSEGGAGEPHASSVFTGAEATGGKYNNLLTIMNQLGPRD